MPSNQVSANRQSHRVVAQDEVRSERRKGIHLSRKLCAVGDASFPGYWKPMGYSQPLAVLG